MVKKKKKRKKEKTKNYGEGLTGRVQKNKKIKNKQAEYKAF